MENKQLLCKQCNKDCSHFDDEFCSANCIRNFFKYMTKAEKQEYIFEKERRRQENLKSVRY